MYYIWSIYVYRYIFFLLHNPTSNPSPNPPTYNRTRNPTLTFLEVFKSMFLYKKIFFIKKLYHPSGETKKDAIASLLVTTSHVLERMFRGKNLLLRTG